MTVDVRCLSIIAASILPIFSPAQEWVVRYNGPGNVNDRALAIAVDDAGNSYVTGTSVDSSYDYATVKYDAEGVEQWVARYDGPVNGDDFASAIAVDEGGNIYVTGSSSGSGTLQDYATVKYDAVGVEQWVARYDGPVNDYDNAKAIAIDGAGNIYVTGYSWGPATGYGYDYATVKYDTSGVEQWVVRYNGPGNSMDWALAIAVDDAGNSYVTGTSVDSSYDYATVKYDAEGVEQWVARYDGPVNFDDIAKAIAIDGAGNVYVTGYSCGPATGLDFDYATVKYDAEGVEQWVARYNGPADFDDEASAIAVDNAGNSYVTGYSYGSSCDYTTVKYSASGVEQWVARYNGGLASAIAVDDAGDIYVTGSSPGSGTLQDYATVKYSASGVEQWVARYDGPASGCDQASAIAIDNAGNIYVTGNSAGVGTGQDYTTIEYSPTGIVENTSVAREDASTITTIFRGPLQLPEGKKCRVFDIIGRVVEPKKVQPGIYFIEVDGVVTQKVVKVR